MAGAIIAAEAAEPVPAFILGQNIEHTRSAGVYADVARWADESIAALRNFRPALPCEIGNWVSKKVFYPP